MTTVARQSVRSGLYSLLTAFQAANPTLLFSSFPVRPTALGVETPGGFTGNLNEPLIRHDSGLRQRNWLTEIVLFDTFAPSNEDEAARLDVLVDNFMDYLTANPIIAGGVQSPVSVTDGELVIQGGQTSLNYRAISIGIQITVQEGRN